MAILSANNLSVTNRADVLWASENLIEAPAGLCSERFQVNNISLTAS